MVKISKLIGLSFLALLFSSCSKVPAGNVGVKVYLLGGSKGVDHEVLGVGRYWIGINEELYLFPTFEQNYSWTKTPSEGSPEDESISFQDKDGTAITADIGISYHINPEKVGLVFQKYRRGVAEITDIFLRNHVRDAFNKVAGTMSVNEIYGEGKEAMMMKVQQMVQSEVSPIGIEITKIYAIGSFQLPTAVTTALNLKIEATQRAQQRENELREAKAQAEKKVAEAEGAARARTAEASAEAKANQIIAASISPTLVEYEKVKRWNGQLPLATGGKAFISIGKEEMAKRVAATEAE